MLPVTLEDVRAAREVIASVLHRTPLLTSHALGSQLDRPVYLKAELFQKTGSFKPRGVLNRLKKLTPAERERGVVTFSAGNHAQALAWAASAAGISATVVMPTTAAAGKIAAARGYGAEVMLHAKFAEGAQQLSQERGLTLVHPFDDPGIIAGAGTVGLEILEDLPDVATVVVAIGGGGLISGIVVAIRSQRPDVRIIGVEPIGADSMARSIVAGRSVRLDHLDTLADGLAAPFAGDHTYAVVRDLVDEVITIPDEEILAGMRFLFERCKLVAEPAGAAATAALLTGRVRLGSGPVVSLVSGGNIDVERFKSLL